jgi:hypothetical protein
MYVDRIIHCRDASHLADRRVRDAFLSAVGARSDLAPELAGANREPK